MGGEGTLPKSATQASGFPAKRGGRNRSEARTRRQLTRGESDQPRESGRKKERRRSKNRSAERSGAEGDAERADRQGGKRPRPSIRAEAGEGAREGSHAGADDPRPARKGGNPTNQTDTLQTNRRAPTNSKKPQQRQQEKRQRGSRAWRRPGPLSFGNFRIPRKRERKMGNEQQETTLRQPCGEGAGAERGPPRESRTKGWERGRSLSIESGRPNGVGHPSLV